MDLLRLHPLRAAVTWYGVCWLPGAIPYRDFPLYEEKAHMSKRSLAHMGQCCVLQVIDKWA